MDPVTIALELAQFAPVIAGWFGGPKAQDVATKVVGVATAVTGKGDPAEAITALRADPALVLQFQTKVLEQQVELEKLANEREKMELDAANTQTAQVNETMRAELQARKFSWRDFWGYVSGLMFAVVSGFVCYMVGDAVYGHHYELLGNVPQVVGSFATLFGIAATVLGVQSSIETHHEGMAKRISAGADK